MLSILSPVTASLTVCSGKLSAWPKHLHRKVASEKWFGQEGDTGSLYGSVGAWDNLAYSFLGAEVKAMDWGGMA